MSKMINIEAAAQKYEIQQDTILIWKRIYHSYAKRGEEILIDENELKRFLRWRKESRFSEEYLEELEKQYHYATLVNETYCEIIEKQEKELEEQDEKIAELEKIKILVDRELAHVQTVYEAISANYNESCNSSWITKLWGKIIK